jgi:hypothetical protein
MIRVAKFTFGLLALLMGTAVLIWCAYCLFVPNQYFHWRLIDIPRLLVPLAMVWVGWNWIRGGGAKGQRYSSELTITLKLSNPDFGTQPERESLLALKHRLEGKLEASQSGQIDGEEFGDGECSLFLQTNAPAEAARLVQSFFKSEAPSVTFSISTSEL